MSAMAGTKYFDGRTGAEIHGGQSEVFDRVKSFVDQCRKEGKKSVVLVGENHDDPTAQEHELDLLKCLAEAGVKPTLSLEFYERDVQPVIDEYLADAVDYETFLRDARPPANHASYRPLIDYCKDRALPVLGANCARRYSRMVGRMGRQKLAELTLTNPDFYRLALPPMPYREASQSYCHKFKEIMGVVATDKSDEKIIKMLDSQSLWDASMAHTIAQSWTNDVTRRTSDVTIQVCGYFHCQHFLGIGEHLPQYFDPEKYAAMTCVVFPEDPQQLHFNSEEHKNIADILIMSDISRLM